MKPEFHQPGIPDDVRTKLSFITDKWHYLHIQDSKRVSSRISVNTLYSIDDVSVSKIIALLKGGAMVQIPTRSKAYVLPNGLYTKLQMRQMCKLLGYSITEDVSKADFIIGNDQCFQRGDINGQTPSNLIIGDIKVVEWPVSTEPHVLQQYLPIENVKADEKVCISRYAYNLTVTPSLDSKVINVLPNKTVHILYQILSRKLPVINEGMLSDRMERVVLDEDMYTSLVTMLNSTPSDIKIASEIIFNCDHVKSIYYMYLLAPYYRKVQGQMSHKNIELINKKINWRDLDIDNESCIDHFYVKGYLTEEIYDKFLDRIISNCFHDLTSYRYANEFVRYDVLPRLSYTEYLDSKTPVRNKTTTNNQSDDESPF